MKSITDFLDRVDEVAGKDAPAIRAEIYEKEEAIHLTWKNPWDGHEERIASFWWPGHPIEATEKVEKLFENYATLFATAATDLPKLSKALRRVVWWLQEDTCPYCRGKEWPNCDYSSCCVLRDIAKILEQKE